MVIKMKCEVKMMVGETIFGLYLDKVKAVKCCRQALLREGITPARVFFVQQIFFSSSSSCMLSRGDLRRFSCVAFQWLLLSKVVFQAFWPVME